MAFVSKRIGARFSDLISSSMRRFALISFVLILELVIAYQVAWGQSLYLLFSFLVLSVLLLASFSLENALLFLFVYMAFDGFIKNLTSYNPAAHIAKDIFLLLIFAAYLISRLLKGENLFPKISVNFPILVFAVICFLQLLNPATNPVVGLGGIKVHVLPITLLFMAFSMLENKEQINRFVVVLILLGTVVASYSLVQYVQGPESVAKLGPGFANVVYGRVSLWRSTTTGMLNFRPFSTAQDCGAAAMYYLITLPLALAFLIRGRSSMIRKLLLVGSVGVLFLALLLSGVRSVWLSTLVGLLLFGVLTKRGKLFFVLLILGWGVLYLAALLSHGGIFERIQLIANPWQAFLEARGKDVTTHLVWAIYAYPFGRGLGRAGPGGAVFSQWFPQEASSFASAHNYFLTMIYEIGVIGALVILWINLAILWNGFRIFKQLQDKDLKWIAAGVISILLAMLLTWLAGPTLITNPGSFYFWFLSGMLLKLAKIERSSNLNST